MGLGISWKKAAIISAVVHLIILFIAVIFFVVVPAIQEQETYEVNLTQSVLDDGGSGHAGGGGGDRSSLFPKPLSADEVAARTKAVVANVEPSTATDIPDAVDVPNKGSENTSNVSGAAVPVMVQALAVAKVAAMALVQERALVMDRAKAKALVRVKALVVVMVELMSLLMNKAFIMQ
ncbi:MAG: hypothetical protein E6X90_09805 [Veillonella sp.]|nr:hypothetical protein [Veillonella sp.]